MDQAEATTSDTSISSNNVNSDQSKAVDEDFPPLTEAVNISRILNKLICDGKSKLFYCFAHCCTITLVPDVKFHDPEVIQTKLEQGIRSRSDAVDPECVVRARGLPWQASDQDIAKFFVGLNLAKSVLNSV